MSLSLRDVGGEVLVVSQFTLYGDVRRGLCPGFDAAASPAEAECLYERYCDLLRQEGLEAPDWRLPGQDGCPTRQQRPGDHPLGRPTDLLTAETQ